MTQKPRKHHYVPQLHLREFYGTDNQLWVYDRQHSAYRRSTSAATGYLPDYYTVDTIDEKDSTEVEKMLSRVESVAGPLLAKLANQESITPVERGDLAIFFALQAVRVPSTERGMTESTEKVMSAVMQEFLNIMTTNEQAFNSVKKQMQADGLEHDFTQEELRQLLADGRGPSLKVDLPRGYTVKMMLDLVNKDLSRGFNKLNWRVLQAPKGHAFITSDNPFVNLGKGFLAPNTFKIFPLTPHKILLIGHTQDASLGYNKCTIKHVHMFNRDIALHSERYVFGHSKQLLKRTVARTRIDIIPKGSKAKVEILHSPDNSGGLIMLSNTGN